MKRAAALGIVLALSLPLAVGCCLCGEDPPGKFAVLASTRTADSSVDVANNIDFWNDLVLTYCTLIDLGFESDDIFVIYGKGLDHSGAFDAFEAYCSGAASSITDIPLANTSGYDKANLCNVLCCLSTGRPAEFVDGLCECKTSGSLGIGGLSCSDPEPKIPRLRKEDFLLTWIKGHGAATDCKTSMTFSSGTNITDEELAGLFEKARPERRVLFFETCDAGGWLDEFEGDGISVVSSSSGKGAAGDCVQTSYPAVYEVLKSAAGPVDLMLHGRFSYWISAVLRESDLMKVGIPSDTDDNNLVSIQEDFDVARSMIVAENAKPPVEFGGPMFPDITAPEGIAPCIFIRLPAPGQDHDVFSMDHPEDDGTPGTSAFLTPAAASPDLWVTYTEDSNASHQPPKTNFDNYIHVRVHNIGCADPGEVTVNFYWAPGDHPGQWNWINSAKVQTPPVGKPEPATAMWSIKDDLDPDLGPYWLIATLSAGDDQPLDGKDVSADNNKVRIQTVVVNS
jgi:hypothetical protein